MAVDNCYLTGRTIMKALSTSTHIVKRNYHVSFLWRSNIKDEFYFGKTGSPNKLREIHIAGEEYRCLVIPGYTEFMESLEQRVRRKKEVAVARYKNMNTSVDWTKLWASAATFKWSVVPFPVRMGHIKGSENNGVPPAKYANTELLKIPNFLHLTPLHIKKHCTVLRSFCNEWPESLKDDEETTLLFPVNVITTEFIRDSPTQRDFRGRGVTLKVNLSSMKLDDHAMDKLRRLAKNQYDPMQNTLTFYSDRCPLRRQNYRYLQYVLAATYHESWKTESWESKKTVADMEKYFWDFMPSKKSIINTLSQMNKLKKNNGRESDILQQNPENNGSLQDLKCAVESLQNDGEDEYRWHQYKKNVIQLLLK